MAEIELDVALEAAKIPGLKLILMDGGLIRYKAECEAKYLQLEEKCLEENIILAGFIKEVKTQSLYEAITRTDKNISLVYDKDLLYGVLDYGQAFILDDEYNPKI